MALSSVVTTYKFNPVEATGTNLVATGASVVPDGHTPVAGDVESILSITGGTGFTAGDYTIIAQNGVAWTLDRSPVAVSGSGGVWTQGGMLPFIHSAFHVDYLSTDGSAFDGSSDPGCIQAVNSGNVGTPGATGANVVSSNAFPLTWENLGVPAGQFAVYVTCRLRSKQQTMTGVSVPDATLAIRHGLATIAGLANITNWGAGWQTYSHAKSCIIESASPSSTSLILDLTLEFGSVPSVGDPFSFDFRFDTLEITTYYDDHWCDYCTNMVITPPTVTLATGQAQNFTTNLGATFAITEGGDSGTLTNVTDTSVTYVAGSTTGTYHLVATDSCRDPLDTTSATATITVTSDSIDFLAYVGTEGCGSDESCNDYGAPTNMRLTNPIAAGTYCITMPVADLNGANPGDNIRVRIRRLWSDPLNTSTDPASIKKFQIEYDVQ